MSIGDDIAYYCTFVGFGLGLTLDTNLFIDKSPESPDQVTVIYEYGGRAPERIQELGRLAYGHPRIQVTCRSSIDDPQAAKILIKNIYNTLGSVRNTVINGTRYMRLDMIQDPFLSDVDNNRRSIYAFNVEAFKDN